MTAESESTDDARESTVSATSPSGCISLSRSRQTWTGAGSAAGFVLRYLQPMRRLMIDMMVDPTHADAALAILIQHLVKVGYGGHDHGRLRDFLIRGIRSATKAHVKKSAEEHDADELRRKAESEEAGKPYFPVPPVTIPNDMSFAEFESPTWLRYWRDCLLERAWRTLERQQHEARHRSATHHAQSAPLEQSPTVEPSPAKANATAAGSDATAHDGHGIPADLAFDLLDLAMHHGGESPKMLAGRVAAQVDRPLSEQEFNIRLDHARVLLAQCLADEVAQTLDPSTPQKISSEIKKLGLEKAFAGIRIQP